MCTGFRFAARFGTTVGYVELYVGYDVPVQIVLAYLLPPLHSSIHLRSVCRPSLPVPGYVP
eukprot:scaffold5073_cov47-Attheya_sp.AAC.3